jgi:hypothetical protein
MRAQVNGRLWEITPHPALRATFPPRGEGFCIALGKLHPLHKTSAAQNRQNSSSVQKNMVSLTKLAANYLHHPQKCDIL